MEFEVLSEEVGWEAKRVAAAFGVEGWKQRNLNKEFEFRFDAVGEQFSVNWWINHMPLVPARLLAVEVRTQRGHEPDDTWLGSNELTFQYEIRAIGMSTREYMACGLYCLGFEDEAILSQLSQLSAHEKLELRLSMPREFWPKTWLNPEEESAEY